jgi:hypothetical protein
MDTHIAKDNGDNEEITDSKSIPSTPYSKLWRELTEDDLSHPAVQKLIISNIDALESQVSELKVYETKYHHYDKQHAILKEKLEKYNSHEILYSICLAAGSWLIWFGSILDKPIIVILVGVLLIISWISSKVIVSKK